MNQLKFIEYAADFAKENRTHIWLGGSFRKGTAGKFSDVDISVVCDEPMLRSFIYGYGDPVYLSYTSNPPGILIVIYGDGVALDLEVVSNIDTDPEGYFHKESIKQYSFERDTEVCRSLALVDDPDYQMARLFHRSLSKFLGGKKELGVSVANEIAEYLGDGANIDENGYPETIISLLERFNGRYPLPKDYLELLQGLAADLSQAG